MASLRRSVRLQIKKAEKDEKFIRFSREQRRLKCRKAACGFSLVRAQNKLEPFPCEDDSPFAARSQRISLALTGLFSSAKKSSPNPKYGGRNSRQYVAQVSAAQVSKSLDSSDSSADSVTPQRYSKTLEHSRNTPLNSDDCTIVPTSAGSSPATEKFNSVKKLKAPVVVLEQLPQCCISSSPVRAFGETADLSRLPVPSEISSNDDCLASPGWDTASTCSYHDYDEVCLNKPCADDEPKPYNRETQTDKLTHGPGNGLVFASLEIADNERVDNETLGDMLEVCARMAEIRPEETEWSDNYPSTSATCCDGASRYNSETCYQSHTNPYPEGDEPGWQMDETECAVQSLLEQSFQADQSTLNQGAESANLLSGAGTLNKASRELPGKYPSQQSMQDGSGEGSKKKRGRPKKHKTPCKVPPKGVSKKTSQHKVTKNAAGQRDVKMKAEADAKSETVGKPDRPPRGKKASHKFYNCTFCKFRTPDKAEKAAHDKVCHPHRCPFCQRHFFTQENLAVHKVACVLENFQQCKVCDQGYTKSRRKIHFHSRKHSHLVKKVRDVWKALRRGDSLESYLASITCDHLSDCQVCHPAWINLDQELEEQPIGDQTEGVKQKQNPLDPLDSESPQIKEQGVRKDASSAVTTGSASENLQGAASLLGEGNCFVYTTPPEGCDSFAVTTGSASENLQGAASLLGEGNCFVYTTPPEGCDSHSFQNAGTSQEQVYDVFHLDNQSTGSVQEHDLVTFCGGDQNTGSLQDRDLTPCHLGGKHAGSRQEHDLATFCGSDQNTGSLQNHDLIPCHLGGKNAGSTEVVAGSQSSVINPTTQEVAMHELQDIRKFEGNSVDFSDVQNRLSVNNHDSANFSAVSKHTSISYSLQNDSSVKIQGGFLNPCFLTEQTDECELETQPASSTRDSLADPSSDRQNNSTTSRVDVPDTVLYCGESLTSLLPGQTDAQELGTQPADCSKSSIIDTSRDPQRKKTDTSTSTVHATEALSCQEKSVHSCDSASQDADTFTDLLELLDECDLSSADLPDETVGGLDIMDICKDSSSDDGDDTNKAIEQGQDLKELTPVQCAAVKRAAQGEVTKVVNQNLLKDFIYQQSAVEKRLAGGSVCVKQKSSDEKLLSAPSRDGSGVGSFGKDATCNELGTTQSIDKRGYFYCITEGFVKAHENARSRAAAEGKPDGAVNRTKSHDKMVPRQSGKGSLQGDTADVGQDRELVQLCYSAQNIRPQDGTLCTHHLEQESFTDYEKPPESVSASVVTVSCQLASDMNQETDNIQNQACPMEKTETGICISTDMTMNVRKQEVSCADSDTARFSDIMDMVMVDATQKLLDAVSTQTDTSIRCATPAPGIPLIANGSDIDITPRPVPSNETLSWLSESLPATDAGILSQGIKAVSVNSSEDPATDAGILSQGIKAVNSSEDPATDAGILSQGIKAVNSSEDPATDAGILSQGVKAVNSSEDPARDAGILSQGVKAVNSSEDPATDAGILSQGIKAVNSSEDPATDAGILSQGIKAVNSSEDPATDAGILILSQGIKAVNSSEDPATDAGILSQGIKAVNSSEDPATDAGILSQGIKALNSSEDPATDAGILSQGIKAVSVNSSEDPATDAGILSQGIKAVSVNSSEDPATDAGILSQGVKAVNSSENPATDAGILSQGVKAVNSSENPAADAGILSQGVKAVNSSEDPATDAGILSQGVKAVNSSENPATDAGILSQGVKAVNSSEDPATDAGISSHGIMTVNSPGASTSPVCSTTESRQVFTRSPDVSQPVSSPTTESRQVFTRSPDVSQPVSSPTTESRQVFTRSPDVSQPVSSPTTESRQVFTRSPDVSQPVSSPTTESRQVFTRSPDVSQPVSSPTTESRQVFTRSPDVSQPVSSPTTESTQVDVQGARLTDGNFNVPLVRQSDERTAEVRQLLQSTSARQKEERTVLGIPTKQGVSVATQTQNTALLVRQSDEAAQAIVPEKSSALKTPADERMAVVRPRDESPSVVRPRDENPSVVKPRDESPSVIKPRDESPSVVRPRDENLSVVRPRDESSSVVKPRDENPSVVKPRDESPSVVKPRDENPSVVRPRDENLSVVRPRDESSSVVKPRDENLSVVRPRDESLSVVKPRDESLSVVKPRDESSSVVKPRHENLSVVRPRDESLSVVKPRDESLSVVKPRDESLYVVRPRDESLSVVRPKQNVISTQPPRYSAVGTPKPSPVSTPTPAQTHSAVGTPKPSPVGTPPPAHTHSAVGTPKPSPVGTPPPAHTHSAVGTPKPSPAGTPQPAHTHSAVGTPKPSPVGTPPPAHTHSAVGTPKPSPVGTPPPAHTHSAEGTPKPSPVGTPPPAHTHSAVGTPKPSPVSTPTPAQTHSAVGTPKPSPVSTPTPAQTHSAVGTPKTSPVSTPTPAQTHSAVGTPKPSPVSTPTPAQTHSAVTGTPKPSPVSTPTPAQTHSAVCTPKPSPVSTPTPAQTHSAVGTPKPSPVSTPTPAQTHSAVGTPKPSPVSTPTPAQTHSAVGTPKPSPVSTPTPAQTHSAVGTPKPSPVSTPTPAQTHSAVCTPKPSPVSTPTPAQTHSAEGTPKPSPVSTPTPAQTHSAAGTPKPSPVSTPTPAQTHSAEGTPKPSPVSTPTPAQTHSAVCTPKPSAKSRPTPSHSSVSTINIPLPRPTSANTATPMTKAVGTATSKPTVLSTPTSKPTMMGTPTSNPITIDIPTSNPTTMGTPTSNPTTMGTPTSRPTALGTPTSKFTTMGTPISRPTALGTPTSKPTTMGTHTSKPTFFGTPTSNVATLGTPTSKPTALSTPTSSIVTMGTPAFKPSVVGTPTWPADVGTPTSNPTTMGTPALKPTALGTPTLKHIALGTQTSKPTAVSTSVPGHASISRSIPRQADAKTPSPRPTYVTSPRLRVTGPNTPTPRPSAVSRPICPYSAVNTPMPRHIAMRVTPTLGTASTPASKPIAASTPTLRCSAISRPVCTYRPPYTCSAVITPIPTPNAVRTPMQGPILSKPTSRPTAVNSPTQGPTPVNSPTFKPTYRPVVKGTVPRHIVSNTKCPRGSTLRTRAPTPQSPSTPSLVPSALSTRAYQPTATSTRMSGTSTRGITPRSTIAGTHLSATFPVGTRIPGPHVVNTSTSPLQAGNTNIAMITPSSASGCGMKVTKDNWQHCSGQAESQDSQQLSDYTPSLGSLAGVRMTTKGTVRRLKFGEGLISTCRQDTQRCGQSSRKRFFCNQESTGMENCDRKAARSSYSHRVAIGKDVQAKSTLCEKTTMSCSSRKRSNHLPGGDSAARSTSKASLANISNNANGCTALLTGVFPTTSSCGKLCARTEPTLMPSSTTMQCTSDKEEHLSHTRRHTILSPRNQQHTVPELDRFCPASATVKRHRQEIVTNAHIKRKCNRKNPLFPFAQASQPKKPKLCECERDTHEGRSHSQLCNRAVRSQVMQSRADANIPTLQKAKDSQLSVASYQTSPGVRANTCDPANLPVAHNTFSHDSKSALGDSVKDFNCSQENIGPAEPEVSNDTNSNCYLISGNGTVIPGNISLSHYDSRLPTVYVSHSPVPNSPLLQSVSAQQYFHHGLQYLTSPVSAHTETSSPIMQAVAFSRAGMSNPFVPVSVAARRSMEDRDSLLHRPGLDSLGSSEALMPALLANSFHQGMEGSLTSQMENATARKIEHQIVLLP